MSWEPTGEPDAVLNPEYVAMRTQGLCDDPTIKAVSSKTGTPRTKSQ
jgi:hypothetical protein